MATLSVPLPLLFLFWTLICQLIGLGVLLLVNLATKGLYGGIAAASLAAFFSARILKLSLPWQILNLILPLVLLYTLETAMPPWVAGMAFLVLIMVYIPTFWTRVPFYPTSKEMYNVIASKLPDDEPFRFIDLGCGFGSLLSYLSKKKPNGTFEGVEISPLPFLVSKLRFLANQRASVKFKSFWNMNLSEYDYVYAFLAPPPMPALWGKVRKELKPGDIFLVNSFPVDAKAESIEEVKDRRKCKLYLYRI